MSSESDSFITVGYDILTIRYYAFATATILFYDYLLTLADEVGLAWSGKQSWAFWLFIVNRYFPMIYQFWLIALAFNPQSQLTMKVCDETAWYSMFVFVVCTFIAQVMLTARMYAVTMKNIPITTGFGVITVSQLVLGAWTISLAVREGAQQLPSIALDAFHTCLFVQHENLEVTYTGISLCYDFLAFSLTLFFATRSMAPGLKLPAVLRTIAEDATRYFLIIFTSHFVLEMNLAFGNRWVLPASASGAVVFLPVMISRMMLSLRKAAYSQQGWPLGESSGTGGNFMVFRTRGGVDEGVDEIPLDTCPQP